MSSWAPDPANDFPNSLDVTIIATVTLTRNGQHWHERGIGLCSKTALKRGGKLIQNMNSSQHDTETGVIVRPSANPCMIRRPRTGNPTPSLR